MPIGRKQVWLPWFRIGLLRTPHLPPKLAQFLVPLTFTKLDLKDYLFHAYGVKVLSIRSYVVQQKIQRIKNLDEPRREFYRPRALKKMTIELETPFVYPPEPTDLQPWDNLIWKAGKEEQKRLNKPGATDGKGPDWEQRNHIFNLARQTLKIKGGKELEEVEVD